MIFHFLKTNYYFLPISSWHTWLLTANRLVTPLQSSLITSAFNLRLLML